MPPNSSPSARKHDKCSAISLECLKQVMCRGLLHRWRRRSFFEGLSKAFRGLGKDLSAFECLSKVFRSSFQNMDHIRAIGKQSNSGAGNIQRLRLFTVIMNLFSWSLGCWASIPGVLFEGRHLEKWTCSSAHRFAWPQHPWKNTKYKILHPKLWIREIQKLC